MYSELAVILAPVTSGESAGTVLGTGRIIPAEAVVNMIRPVRIVVLMLRKIVFIPEGPDSTRAAPLQQAAFSANRLDSLGLQRKGPRVETQKSKIIRSGSWS